MKIEPEIPKMQSVLAFLLLFSVTTIGSSTNPPIAFKRVQTYDWIYDDSRSGASRDVSIWRPNNAEYGYYPLGDTAVASHSEPKTASMMVKQLTPGALKAPVSFTEIWNDRGSGGRHDVRILRMNPPHGYVCLGNVAVLGYSNYPDKNKYRCVRREYVTTGNPTGWYEQIWLDRGSGAKGDVGIWGNRVFHSNLDALDANTFTAFRNHASPTGAPDMLSSRYAKNHQNIEISSDNFVFKLYEVNSMDEIWNDRRSGAKYDVAIWRSTGPDDAYSLGDIAVGGGRPQRGYVVKALKTDAFLPPYDFRKVWDDKGSGARWDGAFYQPLCPSKYRPLGHVAMRNHHEKPPHDAIRCVKAEYTTGGQWQWVWNDRRSGADDDVSVWKAIPEGEGQGVDAMSSVPRHGTMNTGAYVLKPELVYYVSGKPVKRYILRNVQYLLDDRDLVSAEPETLLRTVVKNDGGDPQTSDREFTYEYTEEYSWGSSVGLEFSVATTVEAGIPLFVAGEVTISTTYSFSYEWGGSTTKTYGDKITAHITVPPHHEKQVVIVSNRFTTDVPYTATIEIEYMDGSTASRSNFEGVYRGVQVNDIRVNYEPDVPLIS